MVIPEEKLSEMYTILKSIPHRQVEEMQRQVQVTVFNISQQTSAKLKNIWLQFIFGLHYTFRCQSDIHHVGLTCWLLGFTALACRV